MKKYLRPPRLRFRRNLWGLILFLIICCTGVLQYAPTPSAFAQNDTGFSGMVGAPYDPANVNITGGSISVSDISVSGTSTLEIIESHSPVKIIDGLEFLYSDATTELFHLFISGVQSETNPPPSIFNNTLMFEITNALGGNANNIEVCFWDDASDRPLLSLNDGGIGKASFFERSVIIGDGKASKAFDANYIDGTTTYPNLSFDTATYGADLGVEHDLQVLNIIYASGGNSTNWNTAYGWGDHSAAGYQTSYTETDPIFTAWDKTTGISITESQISDLAHFSSYMADLLGASSERVPFGSGFGGLTDTNAFKYDGSKLTVGSSNSNNWASAYGWGNHSSAGYLTSYTKYTDAEAISAIESEATLEFQQPTTISTKSGGGVLILESVGNSLHLKAGIDIRIFDDVLFYSNQNFWIGSSKNYWFDYSTSGSRLRYWTTNGDGGGTDMVWMRILDGTITAQFMDDIQVDVVNEYTTDAGVTVDSVLLKDGLVDGINVATDVAANTTHGAITSGNPHSVTPTEVGLGNADNTSDANKPISTATQTALDLKAPLTSPVFVDSIILPDGSTQIQGSTPDGRGWHVTTANFKQTKDISAQNSSPRDIHFKPDGAKLYVTGVQGNGTVYEYDLTTLWDISTLTYNSNYIDIDTYEANPTGLYIRPDGKKMYVCGAAGDEVNEFDLSPAWDVTSATWARLYDCSGTETTPVGIEFRPDGLKMYIIGTQGDDVNEYDLSIAWDITTATWLQLFGTSIDAPTGLTFKPDGTKMYVMDGSAEDDIHEYNLTTPWDITTAVLERLFNVSAENGVPQDIAFTPDGTKMYMLGSNSPASMFEYDLGLIVSGKMIIAAINLLEKSADPTQPTEGESVIWLSDGTGKGDAGDVLMAGTAGGTTNWTTLFDHSTGTTW